MNKKGTSKRGQLAIFVIIAILLFILIVGAIWIKKKMGEKNIEVETGTEGITSKQSQAFGSIVSDCLQKLTISGLEVMGVQGGYIYLRPNDEQGTFKNKEGKDVIFKGDFEDVERNGDGVNQLPYWINESAIRIPTKKFMEEELETYIELNMPTCVNNFKELKEKGLKVEAGNIESMVSLNEFVYSKLEWPVVASESENTYTFENAEYKYPLNFGRIYNTAFLLATNELVSNYLEEHAKSLISLYSYSGGEKGAYDLPPLSLTIPGTDCSQVSWTKPEVKNSLRAIFYKNYPYLKIEGTNFTPIATGKPGTQGVYDSFILKLFDKPLPDLSIDFAYQPENDLAFDISPSSGDSINAETFSQTGIPFLPSLCNVEYRYKYSLEIPVLARIKDYSSVKYKEGYEFYFPMKAYICGNQNRVCVGAPAYRTNVDTNALYGEDVASKVYNCSETSGDASINVRMPDGSNAVGVDVTHTCEGFINNCFLGRTDSSGKMNVKVPKCATPKLTLQKKGHAIITDTIKASYELEAVRDYDVEVNLVKASAFLKNYYLSNGFTSVNANCAPKYGSAQELLKQTRSELRKEGDKVTINIAGDYLEIPSIIYPMQKSMKLNSGKYNVSLSYTGKVVIKPSEYDKGDDEIEVSISPTKSGDYSGLWFLGKHEFTWNPSKSSMNGNNVRFYALVDYYSDDYMEVKSIQRKIIQDDKRLVGRVDADKDCDGVNERADLALKPEDYIKFITPEFS